jgi:uncharacterized protein (TIGR00297 family)
MPAKAIPPRRDQLQSRLLVGTVAPLLLLASLQLIRGAIHEGPTWEAYLTKALAISIAFALAAWGLRAATPAAALTGGAICLLLTCYTGSLLKSPGHSALAPLLALFVLTFLATRAGRKRKAAHGLAESRRGRRASQVIANLGVPALLSNLVGYDVVAWAARNPGISDINIYWVLWVAVLAALAEATADTVSSEIGQAFGGQPILLTTLRRVPPGTDGAITLTGTAAGTVAAAAVTTSAAWSMHLSFQQCWIAFAAAILGLFFDSLLGATMERKGWIGNDLVNFSSTAFAAALALLTIRLG